MHIVVFSEEHILSSIRKQSQNLGIPIDFSTEPMPVKVLWNDKSGVYWEGTDQSHQVEQTLAFITYLIDFPKLFPAVYYYYYNIYISVNMKKIMTRFDNFFSHFYFRRLNESY